MFLIGYELEILKYFIYTLELNKGDYIFTYIINVINNKVDKKWGFILLEKYIANKEKEKANMKPVMSAWNQRYQHKGMDFDVCVCVCA